MKTRNAAAVVLLALALTGASLAWSNLCPRALAALCGTTTVPASYLPHLFVAMFAPPILSASVLWALPIRTSYKGILSVAPLLPPVLMTAWIVFYTAL